MIWTQDDTEATLPLTAQPDQSAPFPNVCAACEGTVGLDGYCTQCGQKAKNLREHYTLHPAPWLAGVCDIGLLHARNEDSLACQADERRAVIVVCDGVTTSTDSDVASLAAARAACDLLWNNDPQGTGTASSRNAVVQALLNQAIIAANAAVIAASEAVSSNAAASTIAVAIVDGPIVHCANLGDSRVYWLPDDGQACLLTKDHSLAQAEIDAGVSRATAEASPNAHTITKWLGRDALDIVANFSVLPLTQTGWLLVCSDGLWNYISEPSAIRALVEHCGGADGSASDLADALVAWANQQGGHDNITVACARIDPANQAMNPQGDAVSSTDSPAEAEPGDVDGPATD